MTVYNPYITFKWIIRLFLRSIERFLTFKWHIKIIYMSKMIYFWLKKCQNVKKTQKMAFFKKSVFRVFGYEDGKIFKNAYLTWVPTFQRSTTLYITLFHSYLSSCSKNLYILSKNSQVKILKNDKKSMFFFLGYLV